jgi:hypothetical protein
MLLNAVPLIMLGISSGGITVIIIAIGENPLQSPHLLQLLRVVT